MNLKKILLISALMIMVIVIIEVVDTDHVCVDKTHTVCDGNCECDGFGCPPADPRDYQVEVNQDSIMLFDREKRVGAIPLLEDSAIGSLILNDNQ